MNLKEFLKKNGVTISIHSYINIETDDIRWSAEFYNCQIKIKEDNMLTKPATGFGSTPNEAIDQLLTKLEGHYLEINAHSSFSRVIKVDTITY